MTIRNLVVKQRLERNVVGRIVGRVSETGVPRSFACRVAAEVGHASEGANSDECEPDKPEGLWEIPVEGSQGVVNHNESHLSIVDGSQASPPQDPSLEEPARRNDTLSTPRWPQLYLFVEQRLLVRG